MREAEEMRERSIEHRRNAEDQRARANERRVESEKMMSELISDMSNDGIIKNTDKLTFSLNKNEFIVNGVKQPAPVHDKFKDKYLESPSATISYSRSGNSTHISKHAD